MLFCNILVPKDTQKIFPLNTISKHFQSKMLSQGSKFFTFFDRLSSYILSKKVKNFGLGRIWYKILIPVLNASDESAVGAFFPL